MRYNEAKREIKAMGKSPDDYERCRKICLILFGDKPDPSSHKYREILKVWHLNQTPHDGLMQYHYDLYYKLCLSLFLDK